MATAYHMEALRKQRILNRKHEALCRLADQAQENVDVGDGAVAADMQLENARFADQGHYENSRNKLKPFRVTDTGFNNRYRQRQKYTPHCDLLYAVVYPGKDNSDYTVDSSARNRRINLAIEKYDILRNINYGGIDNRDEAEGIF
ncbi:hypothetical protein ScPMuIL_003554 [Solemya velum]